MRRLTATVVMLFASLLDPNVRSGRADEREDFFEAKIRPVLVGTCFRCHGDSKTSAALRVDSREALLNGGESGPAIVPGQPDESLLIRAIRRQANVSAMPPEKQKALRADQIADFVVWIKAGAIWPAKSAKFETGKHWAFRPIRNVAPPDVQDKAWGKTGIDAFVRVKQEAAGVRPAQAADKLTLIRRATFDLTGLPPTPKDVEAFLHDRSPRAFEVVVDRLLQSPAYGERWGRHWLDVVRYADTAGETADYPVPLAWRYRNYVIDAFNADKPYDEFLREQIAGDVLANNGPSERYAERVTATGYLAISRRFGFDSENYQHLTIQDTIDTLGQSVIGLSLGCARCHDHKFDPVSMHDYYALYGIFDSTRYPFPGSEQKPKVRSLVPLVPVGESQPKWREFESRVAVLAAKLAKQKQPAPAVVLRSLNDIDGDFEMQAPAAGGSNGVLVPPWLYEGKIAVTNAAQSPFKNLFPSGKVGASVPAGAGEYHVRQALYPRRSRGTCDMLHFNLDFRVSAPDTSLKGMHRFSLGAIGASSAVEILISSEAISLHVDEAIERLGTLKPNQWHNLQLTLDLKARTVSGQIGVPGAITEFVGKQISSGWSGVIDSVALGSLDGPNTKLPAIEFDNFGVQEAPILPVSTESPSVAATANEADTAVLSERLRVLIETDGDVDWQTDESPPSKIARFFREARRAQIADLRKQIAALQAQSAQNKKELNALLAEGPFPMAYGMAEGTPHNVRMQVRGEPERPGAEVPRGLIKILGGGPLPAETVGSGRLELAHWLTRPDNPLTARVAVNRIWQYHFGRGLVKTPNDFGTRGSPPTHPELLDYLATQFARSGWSSKAMHRLIILSATYQQSSVSDSTLSAKPVADLYASFPRRRLSAEEIRDSILVVSGELDSAPLREHPFSSPISFGYTQHAPFSAVYDHNKRSIYLMTQRLKRHPFLALFDGADPNATTPDRLGTTVPTQALYFLNDPFVHAKADKWAARLQAAEPGESQQIVQASRGAFGRSPTETELAEAIEFLVGYRAELAAAKIGDVGSRALAAYLRTLIGSNEFLHLD